MTQPVARVFHPLPGLAVHALNPEQGRTLEESRALLENAEQARAAAYHQSADVARFITGRASLRRLVGGALGVSPRALRWVQGPQGKLALDPQQGAGLEFNLSHSGNWVLVALSTVGPVGVDVERMEDHRDLLAIAARVFAPAEREILHAHARAAAVDFFYRTWTCKEAWIKALGVGLSHPLEQLDLHEAAQAPPGVCSRLVDDKGSPDWLCWRLALDAHHQSAVVLAGSPVLPGDRP